MFDLLADFTILLMITFDYKVYVYIITAIEGGSEISFPVGMKIKLAQGTSVQSPGTWELVGIYGQHYYYDVSYYHWGEFLGTSMIHSVKLKNDIASGTIATWNYDSLLNNGTITYGATQASNMMTFSPTANIAFKCFYI